MSGNHSRNVVWAGLLLLAGGLTFNAEALVPAKEVELSEVQGWKVAAVMRGNSVTCSARSDDIDGKAITLLANTGKYRGGVWFLGIVSRKQQLEGAVEETAAHLVLDGKRVATGKALAVGDWVGTKRTATYVRFEFPAIDEYVEDLRQARLVEVQAQGLSPLKIEMLSPIILAIEKCQREGSNPEFWKKAKDVCN